MLSHSPWSDAFTPLRSGFFLCLPFVIYLEAGSFEMGKSLPYLAKAINVPVPRLPAGLQST